ncbi:MAG: carboxypeptidase regulatory-like domain-containing protein, partial [Elusimicrobia bacterium]|nr:carboxypeptidase regulatory-like domain-containing protein [Elusimicrobiota bacterium]
PGALAAAGSSCAAWRPAGDPVPAALAYVATAAADGTFSIPGVPPGTYLARAVGDLDGSAADGDEAAAEQEVVTVTGPASVSLTLSPGGSVTGALFLPADASGHHPLSVSLSDRDGRVLKTLGLDAAPGAAARFELTRVPDGDYTLGAVDAAYPPAYGARPRAVTVAGGRADVGTVAFAALGAVRGGVTLSRWTSSGTVEVARVTGADRTLLPAALRIAAVASPPYEGGFFPALGSSCDSLGCRTPSFDAAGRFLIPGVLPGTYDVELTPGPSGPGVDLAPAVVGGVTVGAGQTVDVGSVQLRLAASLAGTLTSSVDGSPAAGVPVTALPATSGTLASARRPAAAAVTDASGSFTLGGLDPAVRTYDLVLAPRPDDPSQPAPAWKETVMPAVDVLSTTSLRLSIAPAPLSISGRVTADDGAALFSDSDGAVPRPGATLYAQREGSQPLADPLGDASAATAPDGSFQLTGLDAGAWRVTVTALGRAPRVYSVRLTTASASLGTVSLSGGGTVSGALRMPDGSSPGTDSVSRVFAAPPDASQLVPGGLVKDPATQAVTGYRVGGLAAGRTYRLLFVTANDELVSPPEASSVVLASTAEARVLDVVFRSPSPRVTAKSRRTGSTYAVEFQSSQPLREAGTADDDLQALLSTAGAAGTLSGWTLSA